MPASDLVDSNLSLQVDESWGYQQRVEADLDADGTLEEVVLAAQVERVRGRPAWDDGQVWQVYVAQANGQRRVLYSRRLQLGTLTMRLSSAANEAPTIILFEHLPDSLSLYELAYRGLEDVQLLEQFHRTLDPRGDIASPRFP